MHCVLGCKVILSDYKDSGVIVRFISSRVFSILVSLIVMRLSSLIVVSVL